MDHGLSWTVFYFIENLQTLTDPSDVSITWWHSYSKSCYVLLNVRKFSNVNIMALCQYEDRNI